MLDKIGKFGKTEIGKLGRRDKIAFTKRQQENPLDEQSLGYYLEKNTKVADFIKSLGIDHRNINLANLADWEMSGAAGFFNLLLYKDSEIVLRIHLYPGKVEDCYPHCHGTEIKSFVLKGEITQKTFNLDPEIPGCTYECLYKGTQSYLEEKLNNKGGAKLMNTELISENNSYNLAAGHFHTVSTSELTVTLCAFVGPKIATPKIITLPAENIAQTKSRKLSSQNYLNRLLQKTLS